MRTQRLRLAGRLTSLVLMAGCAGNVTTDSTPEVDGSGEQVDGRVERPVLRALDPYDGHLAGVGTPVGAAPGQAVVTVPRMPVASASAVIIAPVTATPPAVAPFGSPATTTFPPTTRSGAVVPEELQRPIGFAWNGSLNDGVRGIAAEVGHRVEVFGPSQPQQVTVAVPKIATSCAERIRSFRAERRVA